MSMAKKLIERFPLEIVVTNGSDGEMKERVIMAELTDWEHIDPDIQLTSASAFEDAVVEIQLSPNKWIRFSIKQLEECLTFNIKESER